MPDTNVLDLTREQPEADRLIPLSQKPYQPVNKEPERKTTSVGKGAGQEEFNNVQETEQRAKSGREDPERSREWWRGMLALILMGLLTLAVLGIFGYVFWLSAGFDDLNTDTVLSVIQTVGTTVLTPLIGLIGAVVGFYYGGQTATQAATQTRETATQAASQTRETVSQVQSTDV